MGKFNLHRIKNELALLLSKLPNRKFWKSTDLFFLLVNNCVISTDFTKKRKKEIAIFSVCWLIPSPNHTLHMYSNVFNGFTQNTKYLIKVNLNMLIQMIVRKTIDWTLIAYISTHISGTTDSINTKL